MTKHFATLDGIKRAAKTLKRRTGMSHNDALNEIAREAGFPDFFNASQAYSKLVRRPTHSITISEFWSDPEERTRGNESRVFEFDVPLEQLVKPHQLKGYLGGAKLGTSALIGYGDSASKSQARAEICRMARTLQFMAATGLKPSRGSRCYPKGDPNNRPPGADHDHGWYDAPTRSYLLTEEPYPGRHQRHSDERRAWEARHGWATVPVGWGSIYGHGTELYLSAKTGGLDIAGLARRLAARSAPVSEDQWPGEVAPARHEVQITEMSPELAAALKHQRDIDIAEAGPLAPELNGDYRGVDVSSRWDVASEYRIMRSVVDAMPDLVRQRVISIWCDSNAQSLYTVRVAPGRWYEGIEFDVRGVLLSIAGGFNGLTVEGDRKTKVFDPEWEGDDHDYGGDIVSEAAG